jgi:hypothetical protein
MRQFLLATFILLFTGCYSQVYTTTLKNDSLGFECTQDNEGADELKILRADKDGTYKIFYDHALLFIANIKDKQYDGQFQKFYNGRVLINGQFSKGKRIGLWSYFNDSNKVLIEKLYRQDTIYYKYYQRDVLQDIVCTSTSFSTLKKMESHEKKECIGSNINKGHVSIIKKLNHNLTNDWHISYDHIYAPQQYGNTALYFTLFSPWTAKSNGNNEGIGLLCVDKKYKDYILKRNPKENSFFETKSYIIYINYFPDWHTDYIKLLTIELKTFFDANKDKL